MTASLTAKPEVVKLTRKGNSHLLLSQLESEDLRKWIPGLLDGFAIALLAQGRLCGKDDHARHYPTLRIRETLTVSGQEIVSSIRPPVDPWQGILCGTPNLRSLAPTLR